MGSKLIAVGIILVVAFAGCKKGNSLSKIPRLNYLYSTTEVKAGSSADTILISFELEDGDADIKTGGGAPNLFISTSRDTAKYNYTLPAIPDAFKDPVLGLRATCIVQLPAAFFLLRDTSMHKDSLHFKLSVEDEAGNRSNEITTTTLYLLK